MKYFKDAENELYIDPIVAKHIGLVEITEAEFNAIKAPTQEELDATTETEAKALKVKLLSEITVTTQAGNVFDGDDIARQDMLSAIEASATLGLASSMWKLANNTWKEIGIAEMKEAHALAIQAKGAILNG